MRPSHSRAQNSPSLKTRIAFANAAKAQRSRGGGMGRGIKSAIARSNAEQCLQRRDDDRSRHEAPDAGDRGSQHNELDAPPLQAASAQRIAHDEERSGENKQRHRGEARRHRPHLQKPKGWKMSVVES